MSTEVECQGADEVYEEITVTNEAGNLIIMMPTNSQTASNTNHETITADRVENGGISVECKTQEISDNYTNRKVAAEGKINIQTTNTVDDDGRVVHVVDDGNAEGTPNMDPQIQICDGSEIIYIKNQSDDEHGQKVDFAINEEFISYFELESKLKLYEKTYHVVTYKMHSRTIEKKRTKQELNKHLKYCEISYACVEGGKKFKTVGKGVRKSSTMRKDCPFKLIFKVNKAGTHLYLKEFNSQHNHECTKERYSAMYLSYPTMCD